MPPSPANVVGARPLRVLALSHAYPRRENRSHGIFVHRLHMGMRRAGAHIDVVQRYDWAPPWPISSLDKTWRAARDEQRGLLDEVDGVAVHHPRTVTPRPSRFFPRDSWERDADAIIAYCRDKPALRDADVVLGHFMVPDGFHAVRLGRALGIPVAVVAWGDDLHGWPEQRPDWRRRLEYVLSEADAVIGCSERMVTDGNAWLPKPRGDWQVIYGGVDLARFTPAGKLDAAERDTLRSQLLSTIEPSRRLLVCLAQATAAKGYVELLDAWKDAMRSAGDWVLAMGGSPGELDVRTEIARRGLENSALWMGPIAPDDIPALLRAADGFVLPSHAEGLSLSMLEALACGVPTIATAVGGHSEVIRNDSEGWLIPPRDVGALASALRELTSSPGERARRGSGGRRAAERIGSPDTNGQRMVDLLSQLAATRA